MDEEKWDKLLAMGVLGIGSFLAGMLPAIISRRNCTRFPLLISILLCFGAGVLLATAMVHILPEVRDKMNSNFAEVALCGGFFIIYLMDELLHFFMTPTRQPNQQNGERRNPLPSAPTLAGGNYGSLDSEREPLLATTTTTNNSESHSHQHDHHHHNEGEHHAHSHNGAAVTEANGMSRSHRIAEPCDESITGTLGLFVAMTLHSAIEGLAIGVQSSATKVLFLLGAVSCHKFVMAFCMGLEFRTCRRASLRSQIIGLSVFAMGAILGIGLGMLIVDIPSEWTNTGLPIIQALAGGSLFYVSVCEVMPREKVKFHHNSARRAAGFVQFLSVVCGFAVMCLLNFFMSDGD